MRQNRHYQTNTLETNLINLCLIVGTQHCDSENFKDLLQVKHY